MTTDPEILDAGPNRPPPRPAAVATVAAATTAVLPAGMAAHSRPPPTPPLASIAGVTPAESHPSEPGAIFSQTAIPAPEDAGTTITSSSTATTARSTRTFEFQPG